MTDVQMTFRVVENLFPRIIAGMEAKAEAIVAATALQLQAGMQTRAAVDTGNMRASIAAGKTGDMTWRVVVGADYGVYVEYGTVHTAAQPFVRPAVVAVRPAFVQALKGVLRP